jgi:hypothetical protein
MREEDFQDLTAEFVEKALSLMHTVKAKHYSGKVDRLAAFKKAGNARNKTAETICLDYMTKHWVHLVDLVDRGETDGLWSPTSEWDEVLTDLLNYCLLMKGLLVDADRLAESCLERKEPERTGFEEEEKIALTAKDPVFLDDLGSWYFWDETLQRYCETQLKERKGEKQCQPRRKHFKRNQFQTPS